MTAYAAARAAQALAVLVIIAFIGFLLVSGLGDPLASLLPADASPADRAAMARALHLDEPAVTRFLSYCASVLRGDFGISYRAHEPVGRLIGERFPATVELALTSLALTLAVGVPAGVYCGIRPEGRLSRAIMLVSIAGVTLPTFVVGTLLIAVFSVKLGWFPSFGRGTTVDLGVWTTGLLTASGWRALVLPAVTLSLFQITFVIRLIRTQLMEVGQSEYIRFARACGVRPRLIWFVHALKNTLLPVLTILALQFGNIIAFSVVTENVFAWPGLGALFLQSVQTADMPVISAYLILIGAMFMAVNLAVELTYPLIDPRVLRARA